MEEDDISAIIREVLQARISYIGWSVPDQSKSGYANVKPGEPDLEIKKGNTTLAVIEAVICDQSVGRETMQKTLAKHFKKALGYAGCKLFFHLTYARILDIESIFTYLEGSLKEPPTDFTYEGHERIPFTDNRPRGFIARYRRGAEEVKVTFLVLDILQAAQKAAAKEGREDKAAKS